jgi:hypothetical protein
VITPEVTRMQTAEKTIEATEGVGAVSMSPSTSLLSVAEDSVVSRLADAWNEFVRLDSVHPDESTEFRRAIHAAQLIIMARPVQRQFNADNIDI